MDPITGTKSTTTDERLKLFDEKVSKLYKACKEAGFSPDKIRETALPVMHAARRGAWKTRGKHGLVAMAVVCLLASLFAWTPTNYAIRVVSKKIMVKVLPYYDWTWPYVSDCVMNNPYYEPEEDLLTEKDCEPCRDFKELRIQTNVSSEDVSNSIFDMTPTLVGDAMGDWRATKESVTYNSFLKFHQAKSHMKDKDNYCFPRISKGLKISNLTVPELLKHIDQPGGDGKKPNFTASWLNCKVETFKEVHKMYYKPYFIPAMCEPVQHRNYVLMGRKSDIKSKALYFHPRNSELGVWIGQIDGTFEILLQVQSVCKKLCSNIRFNLTAGQIVNIPTTMYNIAFRPMSDEAVAIGVGYMFN